MYGGNSNTIALGTQKLWVQCEYTYKEVMTLLCIMLFTWYSQVRVDVDVAVAGDMHTHSYCNMSHAAISSPSHAL